MKVGENEHEDLLDNSIGRIIGFSGEDATYTDEYDLKRNIEYLYN